MAQMLRLKSSLNKTSSPWDAKQALVNALANRAHFLETHPQHIQFQNEIDQMLDKAGDAQGRMTVLAIMMEAKLIELTGQLKSLNGILLKAVRPKKGVPVNH